MQTIHDDLLQFRLSARASYPQKFSCLDSRMDRCIRSLSDRHHLTNRIDPGLPLEIFLCLHRFALQSRPHPPQIYLEGNMSSKPIKLLYWFRTDLRLHDSPALLRALKLQPTEFYPVWCWDPYYVYNTPVGPNRWQFLLDSMGDLSKSLTEINPQSKLFVIRGEPVVTLPYVFKKWGITHLAFEEDDDNQHSQPRDRSVIDAAQKQGVEVLTTSGHTLYSQEAVMQAAKGSLPASYRGFLNVTQKMGHPAKPQDPPSSIPNPGTTELDDPLPSELLEAWTKSLEDRKAADRDVNIKNRDKEDASFKSTLSGPSGTFDIPTMKEIGLRPATTTHRGGENIALKKLEAFLQDKKRVLQFEKPKTSPADFDPPSTTALSPHLKFGTLSPRLFYHRLLQLQHENPKIEASTPPESLIGQLIWREFFHLQQSQIENFHRMQGNKICRYFDWRLKDAVSQDEKDIEAAKWLKAWREGMTGFPWIDAIMRQLNREGWIHHLARHSVACFLTRGHLYISWERGAEVFDDLLIDWDPSLNSGNWMWLSASAYFQQYFRVYSPIQFGKKWDPDGKFIRHYCPELKKIPQKFIYQPWEAPMSVQEKANCIIGKDYPKPIVNEKEAKDEALRKMKEGYSNSKFGSDMASSPKSSTNGLSTSNDQTKQPRKRKMDPNSDQESIKKQSQM
ncbi:hypothetical protein O181_009186 [Austropuccinia psidii MF-1]|uniref:Photolyase/cryptochrome alpha/beta domain-containing protein n=1 Tax=Austropuccinia psidii MF-1 TaxID=1389203 RepID=A0A9Q3BNV2_9BASI|nr:hypothetical protein [Austropuccinia psidii MF-1]